MPKSTVEEQLEDALTMLGWRWMHQRPCQTRHGWRTALSGHKGFPDYVAVRGDRILFIEAKGKANALEPDQKDWHDALVAAGAEHHLVRPKDLVEFVQTVLARRP